MQWQRDGYTIDTDRARLPMDIVRWLNTTYWAATRPPEVIRRAWANTAVVFGLYYEEIAGWGRDWRLPGAREGEWDGFERSPASRGSVPGGI